MRGFKALWRLALGKRQNRPLIKTRQAKLPVQSEPAATDFQDPKIKLLSAEPPTRTLQ